MLEAYSVAVRLRLLDSYSGGLIAMAGHFSAFNRHVQGSTATVKALEDRLKSIKMMGFVGGAAMGVGLAGLYAFRAPLDEARQWQQEAARFASLGFGAQVNTDAEQFARGMNTYGTSARENLTLLSDAMTVFKNLDHAKAVTPLLAKMKFANEAIFGAETGGANERQFMDMLKVIELRRGLSSEKEFATQADYVQKAISGSRGRVNASQWLQLLKTGGVGVSQISNESFYLGLEPLVQEFGGARLGTSLMSVYQNLVQARGSLTAQRELYRLGLLDPQKVQFNSLGQLKKTMPGAFQGSAVYETEGPLALLNKVLIPAFARKGITSESQIIDELGLLLSNRTAAGLLARAYQQRASIETQAAANRNAMGINELHKKAQETPDGKWLEMTAQYRNLMLELGTAVLPIAMKAVDGVTSVLRMAVSVAREFPGVTKGLVIFGTTLFGLIAVGGAVTLAAAGFKALGLALAVSKGVGLGAQLISVAGGIGGLAANLGMLAGKLGLLSAAAYGGYKFGGWLNHLGPNDDLGGWAQSKLADWWHRKDPKYDVFHIENGHATRVGPNAPTASTQRPQNRPDISPFIAPFRKTDTVVNLKVDLDGRKIAESTTRYLNLGLGAPQTGISGFDGILLPAPAGGIGGY